MGGRTTEYIHIQKSGMMTCYVIRNAKLDDIVENPSHPHLYWANDWGWGTYDGASVFTEQQKQEMSIEIDGVLIPSFPGEECYWDEVPADRVGHRLFEYEFEGKVEPCVEDNNDFHN